MTTAAASAAVPIVSPVVHAQPAVVFLGALRRQARLRTAYALAADRNGVLTRSQLTDIGVGHRQLSRILHSGLWVVGGRRTVVLYTGPRRQDTHWRVVIDEVGGHCALDGSTALIAAGLSSRFDEGVHLSIPRGAIASAYSQVRVHETRRRRPGDVLTDGIPRVRPEIAAVRAALWATSDRQAALYLAMTVQQRIASAAAVSRALGSVQRDKRRGLLRMVMKDIMDGAHSLGEIDFAALCRLYEVRTPSRQVVRTTARGRHYLDVEWDDCGLVAEIEGIHHGAARTQLDDALRQNELTAAGSTVIRIPVIGLRTTPALFLRQIDDTRHRLLAERRRTLGT